MTWFPDLIDDLSVKRIRECGLQSIPWSYVLAEPVGMTAEERNAARPPLVPYSREELEAMERQDRLADKAFAKLIGAHIPDVRVDQTVALTKAALFARSTRDAVPPWSFPTGSESEAYARRLAISAQLPEPPAVTPPTRRANKRHHNGRIISPPPSHEVAVEVLEQVLSQVWRKLKPFRRSGTPALHVVWAEDPVIGPVIRFRFGVDASPELIVGDIVVCVVSAHDATCYVAASQVPDGYWPELQVLWSGVTLPWYRCVEATTDYVEYLGAALIKQIGQVYLGHFIRSHRTA